MKSNEVTVSVDNVAHSGDAVPTRTPQRRTGGNPGWTKGQSGNPAGKPKGTKNKLTLLREAQMEKQEKKLLKKYPELMETVMTQAVEGCRQSHKMMMELFEKNKRADEEKGEGADKSININIMGAKASKVSGSTIEAEFEEL